MIASLPMYATPYTAASNARLWAGIRDRLRDAGIAAPDKLTLTPGPLLDHWRDPDLILSQTCSLPFRSALKDDVALVGTPDYRVKGCPAGYYYSVIIARAEDTRSSLSAFKKARFAYNDPMSQSGWASLALEHPEVLTGPLVQTGSHRASVMAVRSGEADFAAIDAVTWRLICSAVEATGLQVIHQTQPTAGLPLITAKTRHSPVKFEVVKGAIDALTPDDSYVLGLHDLIAIPPSAYDLPLPPPPDSFLA